MQQTAHKLESDAAMIAGMFWDIGADWLVLDNPNESATIMKADGGMLCKVVRRAIPKELCDLGYHSFVEAGRMVTTNRGHAAGAQTREHLDKYERGKAANSGIIGYLDSSNHKRPCRLTEFSRSHLQEYTAGLPFIRHINKCFKEYVPFAYEMQSGEAAKSPEFVIEDTVFSTVTVNWNFRTALHKDSGDFRHGFGNLSVVTDGITGGYLLFPQFHVAVSLFTGDYLAADVHEWHCNSPMTLTKHDGYRLSFVCYLREKIGKCADVNRRLGQITGDLSGKEWDTSRLYHDIFDGNVPDKEELTVEDARWWCMQNEKYVLTYKKKRYKLYDKTTRNIVYNLLPAWEYAMAQRV